MELVAFTVVAVVLYLVADRVVLAVERRRGARLTHRTLLFFGLLLGLGLMVFPLMRRLFGG